MKKNQLIFTLFSCFFSLSVSAKKINEKAPFDLFEKGISSSIKIETISLIRPIPCCLVIALNQMDILDAASTGLYYDCINAGGSPVSCGQMQSAFWNAGMAYIEAGLNDCEQGDGNMECGDF